MFRLDKLLAFIALGLIMDKTAVGKFQRCRKLFRNDDVILVIILHSVTTHCGEVAMNGC